MQWKELEKYPNTWKWVFLVASVIFLLGTLGDFPNINFDLGSVISLGSLVAVYGLAYERKIWARKFWRGFFWFCAVLTGLVALIIVLSIAKNSGEFANALVADPGQWGGQLTLTVILLAVYVVQLRGLYLYGFKKEQLWA